MNDEIKEKIKAYYIGNDIDKVLDYITNLQQLEQEHQKINGKSRERIAYLERSNDRREDTILGLRQEINDVEDKNSKLEIALQNIQEDYDRRVKEIDVLKEQANENKVIVEYTIKPSFTTRKLNDYKSRCEKAIEYINRHKEKLHHSFDEPDCDYWIATNPDDLLNILQNGSDSQ